MKKIISCFLSLLFVVSFVFPMTKVSAIDYQVHVAILCQSRDEALNYAHRLCEYKAIEHPMEVELTSEVNTEELSTVVRATDIDTNYHIKFHIIPDGGDVSDLDSIIKKCSAVIVLYDISDPSLDPIVESKIFFEKDLKKLKKWLTKLPTCDKVDKSSIKTKNFIKKVLKKLKKVLDKQKRT
mgnify:CR=1 FL=1